MENQESTTGLFKALEGVTSKPGLEKFNQDHTNQVPASFQEYMNLYLAKHPDIHSKDIIKNSGMSPDYAREILRGAKNGSRDRIIALCLAAHMDLKEVRRALKISNLGDLYPKVDRDKALIICINQETYNITKINEFLLENRLKPLVLFRPETE